MWQSVSKATRHLPHTAHWHSGMSAHSLDVRSVSKATRHCADVPFTSYGTSAQWHVGTFTRCEVCCKSDTPLCWCAIYLIRHIGRVHVGTFTRCDSLFQRRYITVPMCHLPHTAHWHSGMSAHSLDVRSVAKVTRHCADVPFTSYGTSAQWHVSRFSRCDSLFQTRYATVLMCRLRHTTHRHSGTHTDTHTGKFIFCLCIALDRQLLLEACEYM